MHIFSLPRTGPAGDRKTPHSYLFFASSDPLYRYHPDPLPDFSLTAGGWGISPFPHPRPGMA